jgi:hypothetical protein
MNGNWNEYFNKVLSEIIRKNLKHFEHGKAALGLLLCPKSVKNGQIITDLSKTVHFGKYYLNKLQLNFKK